MVKLNFSDFNITLKPYVTNFNHGYVMAWVSRWPLSSSWAKAGFSISTHHRWMPLCIMNHQPSHISPFTDQQIQIDIFIDIKVTINLFVSINNIS